MKSLALCRIYITGLLLSGVSAIIGTVFSGNNHKKIAAQNGIYQASNGVSGAQLTCTNGGGGAQCTDTRTYFGDCNGGGNNNGSGSRTSVGGARTSLITTASGVGCVSTITSSPRLAATSA